MHEGNHFTVMVFIHSKNQHTFQSARREKNQEAFFWEGKKFLFRTSFHLCSSFFFKRAFSLSFACNLPGRKTKEAHAETEKCVHDDVRCWWKGMKNWENPYYKRLKRHVVNARQPRQDVKCLFLLFPSRFKSHECFSYSNSTTLTRNRFSMSFTLSRIPGFRWSPGLSKQIFQFLKK